MRTYDLTLLADRVAFYPLSGPERQAGRHLRDGARSSITADRRDHAPCARCGELPLESTQGSTLAGGKLTLAGAVQVAGMRSKRKRG